MVDEGVFQLAGAFAVEAVNDGLEHFCAVLCGLLEDSVAEPGEDQRGKARSD